MGAAAGGVLAAALPVVSIAAARATATATRVLVWVWEVMQRVSGRGDAAHSDPWDGVD
jgi:hypothetical protein